MTQNYHKPCYAVRDKFSLKQFFNSIKVNFYSAIIKAKADKLSVKDAKSLAMTISGGGGRFGLKLLTAAPRTGGLRFGVPLLRGLFTTAGELLTLTG